MTPSPLVRISGKILLALLVAAAALCWFHPGTAPGPRRHEFGGPTMGSTYSVTVAQADLPARERLHVQREVANILDAINRHMSLYDPASDISRFNRATNTTPFPMPADLMVAADLALRIAEASGGAFDPTVFPLVDLWGFGARRRPDRQPEAAAIAAQRERVDYHRLQLQGANALRKTRADVALDLNAVADGYAADLVADYLKGRGYSNVLVNVCGEIVACGESAPGEPWRVAIETPTLGAVGTARQYRRLALADRALATSGDYRNFFEERGRVYSHIIDPHTGYPVSNGVASVSVLAPDCRTAGALGVTLMVLGPEAGLRLLASQPGVEALMIVRNADGSFTTHTSPGFPP